MQTIMLLYQKLKW